jgi:hypothetical protein
MPVDVEDRLRNLGRSWNASIEHATVDEITQLGPQRPPRRDRGRWITGVAAAFVLLMVGALWAVASRDAGRSETADSTSNSAPPQTTMRTVSEPEVPLDRVDASVVETNPTEVVIDVGLVHGLRVGMPVVNEVGLVGKVTTVTETVSTVMLLTDERFQIAAKSVFVDAATSERFEHEGLLSGRGAEVDLQFEPSEGPPGEAQEGSRFDEVFTAGGRTSLAPPDILIGTSTNVENRPGAPGLILHVSPVFDIRSLAEVTVLLFQPPDLPIPTTIAPSATSESPTSTQLSVLDALEEARRRWSEASTANYELTVAENANYWSKGCIWTTTVTDGMATSTQVGTSSADGACVAASGIDWTVDMLYDRISSMARSLDEYADPDFGQHTLVVTFSDVGVPESIEYDLANGDDEESSMQVTFAPLP